MTLVFLVLLVVLAGAHTFHQLPNSHRASDRLTQQVPQAATTPAAQLGLYSVEAWSDASLGNHRARVQLSAVLGPGVVAWAHVQWRLPGLVIDPQQLRMQTQSGESIELHVLSIDSEAVTLLFEPLSCGSGPEEVIVVGQPSSTTEETCSYLLYYLYVAQGFQFTRLALAQWT